MKVLCQLILGALAACWAASAFAQPLSDNSPKTREQVRQETLAWFAAGYDPTDWVHYPENAIRASRVLAQQRAPQGQHQGLGNNAY
ncbi:DUF4148 domain-containing protein [Caballeronia sp. ATUFL_M2_KS44]|uniref:DUF4148 domain-containing protein n=1 Tax=Caballeronia sp. ATUFL_M2_KS44 TaxID=2921767 RepID=UPI0020288D65|nr:DUF4148 domain-containing protein [Caballeronia sp. ATUFL_M2_KS44]